MIDPAAAQSDLLPEDVARRGRARARIYLFCQLGGWGLFLGLQLIFYRMFESTGRPARSEISTASSIVVITVAGLLLTHYSRRFIERWGWKQLGWRALLPRVAAASVVLSLVWTALGLGYTLGVLHEPWEPIPRLGLKLGLSVTNGGFIFAGWYCVYFCYHLFDRYNRLQIEQLRLAALVHEAELRALKSQINPHFIFNSLNSLRALIDENPVRARQAVTQLANLLRYSLQSAQSETVAFESELRVVSDYLALEQVRHEERLRVRLDVEPETLTLAVPPLLLQTLVENAVKYGISQRPEGGEILVTARCVQGQLELRVINPGELPAAGAVPSGSTGVGLKNAAERLRLFFGDRAWLRLRAEDATHVVAEVSLPMQEARA